MGGGAERLTCQHKPKAAAKEATKTHQSYKYNENGQTNPTQQENRKSSVWPA